MPAIVSCVIRCRRSTAAAPFTVTHCPVTISACRLELDCGSDARAGQGHRCCVPVRVRCSTFAIVVGIALLFGRPGFAQSSSSGTAEDQTSAKQDTEGWNVVWD